MRSWGRVCCILLILLVGCSNQADDPRVEIQRAELDAAVLAWESGDRSDYTYVYLRTCVCVRPEPQGPNSVFVVDGEVLAVEHFGTRESLDGFTAEDLFEQTRQAIDDGENLEATYDPANGLPISLNLDLDAGPTEDPLILELRSFLSYADERTALTDARALWDSADLDNYRLRFESPDAGAVNIEVNNGVAVSNSADASADEQRTITDFFDEIEAAINARADSLAVEYDPALGHPTSYQIVPDISRRDEVDVASIRVTQSLAE